MEVHGQHTVGASLPSGEGGLGVPELVWGLRSVSPVAEFEHPVAQPKVYS